MILDSPHFSKPHVDCLCEQNYDLNIAMEAMAHWEMIHEEWGFTF